MVAIVAHLLGDSTITSRYGRLLKDTVAAVVAVVGSEDTAACIETRRDRSRVNDVSDVVVVVVVVGPQCIRRAAIVDDTGLVFRATALITFPERVFAAG
jgi:hypothetical protein